MTPLEAIARQLWLSLGQRCYPSGWPAAWEWYNDPANKSYVADSAVGKAVAQAERILRLLDAAGLEVRKK